MHWRRLKQRDRQICERHLSTKLGKAAKAAKAVLATAPWTRRQSISIIFVHCFIVKGAKASATLKEFSAPTKL